MEGPEVPASGAAVLAVFETRGTLLSLRVRAPQRRHATAEFSIAPALTASVFVFRGPTHNERPLNPHPPLRLTLAAAEAPVAAVDKGAVATPPNCPCDYCGYVVKTTHSYYRIHLTTNDFPAKPHAAGVAVPR